MGKWMKAILAAACIAALLAGCGTKAPETPQQPEEEPASETPEPVVTVPTLAELRTANDPVEILKGHRTVSIIKETRQSHRQRRDPVSPGHGRCAGNGQPYPVL